MGTAQKKLNGKWEEEQKGIMKKDKIGRKKKDCEEMNELLSIVGANEKHVICFFVISLLGLCQQFHTHYAAVFLFFHFSIVKK